MLTILSVLAGGTAFAQLADVPPPSSDEGISPMTPDATQLSAWMSSDLGKYNVEATGNQPVPGDPDHYAGLNWSTTLPSGFATAWADVAANGGSVRAIFTGKTAGWENDFGYTYNSTPADTANSYTVFSNIKTGSIPFGTYVDIPLLPGDATTFDFWLNGTDSFTDDNPTPPTPHGGYYTAINPLNSDPYISPGNVMWTTTPISVSTFDEATGDYRDVNTYLVAFEDWNLNNGSDRDYSDFIFAVQLYNANGLPEGGPLPSAVPEPSTYGVIGALGLLGLAALRRKAKK
jgi:hypothetical protein